VDRLEAGARADEVRSNKEFLRQSPNRLQDFLPEASIGARVIKIINVSYGQRIVLIVDIIKQKAVVYIERVNGADVTL